MHLAAPITTVIAALAALAAWWWAPLLVAGTPLVDLGFVVNLAAVFGVLCLVDWLLARLDQPH
jgi:hypothetical protein